MADDTTDVSERRLAVRWAATVLAVCIAIWIVAARTGTPRATVVAPGATPAERGGDIAPTAGQAGRGAAPTVRAPDRQR